MSRTRGRDGGAGLKNLDLNLLVIFEAIYSARNISRAAEQLAMSQPAVSNALARLREFMDDPLFVRGRRGVLPTVKATQMIEPVRDALRLIGRQLDPGDLDLATYKRHFRILLTDPLEPIIIPPLLRQIAEKAPNVTIEVHPAFRTDFVKEIQDGSVDLSCHAYPGNFSTIATAPIGPYDVVLAARRDHPAWSGNLDVETFQSLGHVVLVSQFRSKTQAEQGLVGLGYTRRVVYTVTKAWSMVAIVSRTDLVCMMPRWFVRDVMDDFGLAIHELPMSIPEQYMYMAWHTNSTADSGHKWLRESLLANFRQNLALADATATRQRPTG